MTAVDCFDWSQLFVEPIDLRLKLLQASNVALHIADDA